LIKTSGSILAGGNDIYSESRSIYAYKEETGLSADTTGSPYFSSTISGNAPLWVWLNGDAFKPAISLNDFSLNNAPAGVRIDRIFRDEDNRIRVYIASDTQNTAYFSSMGLTVGSSATVSGQSYEVPVSLKKDSRTVTFSVRNSSGVPIQGASINVNGLLKTDSNGMAVVDLPEGNEYSVSAWAEGYSSYLRSLKADTSSSLTSIILDSQSSSQGSFELSNAVMGINMNAVPKQVSRAEMVSFLVHSLGFYDASATSSFADVPPGHKYYREVSSAYRAGLVTGTGGSSFDPDGYVTRAQYAVLLMGALKYDVSGQTSDVTDVDPDTQTWCYPSISAALNYGLMSYSDASSQTFSPDSTMTGNLPAMLLPLFDSQYTGSKVVTWSSGNSSVAVVDANGQVAAVSPGVTVISATDASGTVVRSCTVKVVSGTDCNNSGITDLADLAILSLAYGSNPSDMNWDGRADFNADWRVDSADFAALRQGYGR
jgi:hypothetical protein